MISAKRNRICPVELAGTLDSVIRKLVHNPKKILSPYLHKGMAVLDLGCGPGFFSIEMANLVGASGKVVAADLQEGMLKIVKAKIKKNNLGSIIELHKCQKDKLGLKKKFDFVLIFYMLHEIPEQPSLLQEVRTLLNPGARILIVEPKFHVSKIAFGKSIETLNDIGFTVIEEPNIFLSRSVLVSKDEKK
jgi:ubiquinone/menaquinone biosynthesis C-methylase UbiE